MKKLITSLALALTALSSYFTEWNGDCLLL